MRPVHGFDIDLGNGTLYLLATGAGVGASWSLVAAFIEDLVETARRIPIMPPQTIRTLPFGTGLILLRSAPPLVTDLRSWTHRPDAADLQTGRADIESVLQRRR